jgi:predicted RNase H-like HicB family nuclease
MAHRFYPAVLERGEHDTYGVWFPDFPGAVAAARNQEDAMGKAEEILALAAEALAERGAPMPEPTAFDAIAIPKGCELVTAFAVRTTLPNPSERVNIYLPKALIERMDRRAEAQGMSRSSLAGFAISRMLDLDQPVWVKGQTHGQSAVLSKVKRVK